MNSQKMIWDKEYFLHKNKWKKESIRLPKLFSGKVVLEIGFGNGKTLAYIIAQKPSKVYAIDYSREAILYCKKNISFKNLLMVEMDAKKMSFDNEFFDIIVCNYVLNNMLSDGRKKAVNEMYRILKKKGKIIFEDFMEKDFRQKSGKKYRENNTIIKKNGIICHFFNKKELKELFNGFKINKLDLIETSPIKGKSYIKRNIARCLFEK